MTVTYGSTSADPPTCFSQDQWTSFAPSLQQSYSITPESGRGVVALARARRHNTNQARRADLPISLSL